MATIIQEYFKTKRLERGLTCHELARLIGYRN